MLVIKLGKKSGGLEACSGNLGQHGEIPSECAYIYIYMNIYIYEYIYIYVH